MVVAKVAGCAVRWFVGVPVLRAGRWTAPGGGPRRQRANSNLFPRNSQQKTQTQTSCLRSRGVLSRVWFAFLGMVRPVHQIPVCFPRPTKQKTRPTRSALGLGCAVGGVGLISGNDPLRSPKFQSASPPQQKPRPTHCALGRGVRCHGRGGYFWE